MIFAIPMLGACLADATATISSAAGGAVSSLAGPLASPATAPGSEGLPRITIDDVLSPFIYVFYAAFIVSFIFTPLMQVVATY